MSVFTKFSRYLTYYTKLELDRALWAQQTVNISEPLQKLFSTIISYWF